MTPAQPYLLTLKEPESEYLVRVTQSPWDNVYWFARMLIASDKYGGVGSDRKTMLALASASGRQPPLPLGFSAYRDVFLRPANQPFCI